MNKIAEILLIAICFILSIGFASSISSLQNRVAILEERAAKMEVSVERSFPWCARGVAVMTPSGAATTVCAP